MKVVLLCGGRGRRAWPLTEERPKALLPVAGKPLLAHLMEIFAAQGLREFVLCAGYLGGHLAEFAEIESKRRDWRIDVVLGLPDDPTGARVLQCEQLLSGRPFILTYGDGLADVSVERLLAFHRGHPGAATMTTVPLKSQFGTVETGGGHMVRHFVEKPVVRINAGFLVFESAAWPYFSERSLEQEILPRMAAAGQLYAYPHDGYFKAADTEQDFGELNDACLADRAPWRAAGPELHESV
ncbi:glucose-1-phosphate cytidylyltransferase [Actinomadura vinacea]|uniref:Glucose-1-phosphate cytidylyltransferase n=1 Tax=Actinomadura vinacea TaxID=115336 RepID=A0ABN3IJK1_9ACTN